VPGLFLAGRVMIAAAAAVLAAAVVAVVAVSAIAEAFRRVRKAARSDPDDMEALADATREAPQWTDEQIERLRKLIEKDGEK